RSGAPRGRSLHHRRRRHADEPAKPRADGGEFSFGPGERWAWPFRDAAFDREGAAHAGLRTATQLAPRDLAAAAYALRISIATTRPLRLWERDGVRGPIEASPPSGTKPLTLQLRGPLPLPQGERD